MLHGTFEASRHISVSLFENILIILAGIRLSIQEPFGQVNCAGNRKRIKQLIRKNCILEVGSIVLFCQNGESTFSLTNFN
jgi:hypothetical protein